MTPPPIRQTDLAVVVLSKNEQSNIQRCLNSVRWADEIVVIDDHSEDRTAELAEQSGARVVSHAFESFASQRNWAIDHAGIKSPWVLMLDADELATSEFADEVRRKIATASTETVAFKTCRKTMLDGTWLKHSDGFPVWIMRLVRRERAYFQDSGHGEVPVPEVDGMIGTIKSPFIHESFSRGMDDWWARHTRYAKKEALRERFQESDASLLSLLSLDRSKRRKALRHLSRKLPGRGSLRFIYQYILKRGFMDGPAGYRFCKMMACYESMIVIRKLEPDTITGSSEDVRDANE